MKLGQIPVRRLFNETDISKPPVEAIETTAIYALAGALSAAPGIWQYNYGHAPTLLALPLVVAAGAFAYAMLTEREYLFWAPGTETIPEPEQSPQPAIDLHQQRIEQIQATLDEWEIRANVVKLLVHGKTLDIAHLEVARGYDLDKPTFPASFSRDLHLPKGAKISVDANIGDGLAAMLIPKTVRGEVTLDDVYQQLSKPFTFCTGEAADGSYTVHSIEKVNHILWAGETNSGKSVNVNACLLQLAAVTPPHLLRVTLVDPKQKELRDYQALPHYSGVMATTPQDTLTTLLNLYKEMKQRELKIGEAGCRNIAEYNTQVPHAPLPYHVVVIDEMVGLIKDEEYGKRIDNVLQILLSEARSSGIKFWAGSQRLGSGDFSPLLRDGFGHYVGFRVKTAGASRVITEGSECTKLLGMGDCIDGIDPMSPTRTQGANIDSDGIRLMIKRIKQKWKRNTK